MNPITPENNKEENTDNSENPNGELIIEHDINQAAQNIVNEISTENESDADDQLNINTSQNSNESSNIDTYEGINQANDNLGQQPTMPIQTEDFNNASIVKETTAEPKFKKHITKTKLLLFIVLGMVLFFGISASVYAGVYLPNKPNNVVRRSVANVFDTNYYNAVKAKLTIQSDGQMAELNTTAGTKDDITRADFGLKYSVFNVEGSAIYNSKDKTAYVKINGLDQLMNQFLGSGNAKVSNNWVKLQSKELVATESAADNNGQLKCLQGLLDLAKTNEFKGELLKTYTSNEFINAKKVGSEKIDDKKTNKYLLVIDKNKADQFAKQLENSSMINDKLASIDPKCNEDAKSSANGITSEEDMKIDNFYVWVNSSKQLVQLSLDISQTNSRATLQLNMLKNSNLDFSIPKNSVDGFDKLFGESSQEINGLSL
jgi:hypothetical protein